MGEQPSLSNRLGVTRGKLITMGVLAIAFLVVLRVEYGGSTPEVVPTKLSTRSSRRVKKSHAAAPTPSPNDKHEEPMEVVDTASWAIPELTEVIAYDPFALPAAFPQPKAKIASDLSGASAVSLADPGLDAATRLKEVERIRQELEQLRRQGVQIILTEGDQFVAMIGDETVRVGDKIGEFKITAIDADGVHVERAIQQ
jgi:hypothetical protein